jgi:hypothetical protein
MASKMVDYNTPTYRYTITGTQYYKVNAQVYELISNVKYRVSDIVRIAARSTFLAVRAENVVSKTVMVGIQSWDNRRAMWQEVEYVEYPTIKLKNKIVVNSTLKWRKTHKEVE